ncbi:MAG: flippase [bacterium]|nr:flippase [bacterium]
MNRLDSILRNTLFSFIARFFDVAVTFALGVILARYLGPEGIGDYTYIIAFVSIFVPLIDLGLDHILIREIARNRETARDYIGAALLLKLLIVVVVMPLGVLVTGLIGNSGINIWAFIFCFLGAMLMREIPTVVGYAVFLAYERMEYRAIVTLLFQIVKFIATFGVIFSHGGMVAIFAAALLAETFQGIAAIILVWRKFSPPRLVFNLSLWKRYVKESLPIGIAFAFHSLYFQVDVLVLKYFRSSEETGWFGVPFRIVTTLFTLLIPMIWVLLPHLTQAAKESIKQLDHEGQGYLKGILVLTAGITVFLGLEANDIIITFFGIKFQPSALVLIVTSPVIIFHSITYFFDLTLTAVGRQRLIVIGATVIFVAKLGLDLLLVPNYGIMGAALGTLASEIACFMVMFSLTRKHVTSFGFGTIILRPLYAITAAGLLLFVIRPLPVYITFFVFSISYLLFIRIFKVVSPDQQRVFQEMAKGIKRKFGLAPPEPTDLN